MIKDTKFSTDGRKSGKLACFLTAALYNLPRFLSTPMVTWLFRHDAKRRDTTRRPISFNSVAVHIADTVAKNKFGRI